MTTYTKDSILSASAPLLHRNSPEAYELRLVDEDSKTFSPDYSIGALDRRERLGTHDALAFVQNKNYKPKNQQEEEVDPKVLEKLKAEGKRLISV
jgi:hypothetical protein